MWGLGLCPTVYSLQLARPNNRSYCRLCPFHSTAAAEQGDAVGRLYSSTLPTVWEDNMPIEIITAPGNTKAMTRQALTAVNINKMLLLQSFIDVSNDFTDPWSLVQSAKVSF